MVGSQREHRKTGVWIKVRHVLKKSDEVIIKTTLPKKTDVMLNCHWTKNQLMAKNVKFRW